MFLSDYFYDLYLHHIFMHLISLGASRGQIVIWNDELFECLDVMLGAFSLSIKSKNKGDGLVWCLTFVYVLVCPYEREDFWLDLYEIRALWNIPWCLGGNFNAIRFSQEKRGGSRNTRTMRAFNAFVNACALMDLPLLNVRYTWCNLLATPSCSRLDRYLLSHDWLYHLVLLLKLLLPG